MSFPHVISQHVIGQPRRDYRLSWSDLAEINRLVAHRADILRPIGIISMEDADHGEVRSGPILTMFATVSLFKIYKKNGHWFIDDSSIRSVENAFTS